MIQHDIQWFGASKNFTSTAMYFTGTRPMIHDSIRLFVMTEITFSFLP